MKFSLRLPAFTSLLFLCSVSPAQVSNIASLPHPRGYVCYKSAAPVMVDGVLDDPAWRSASWTDYFVDIEGDKKPLPRYKTRVKMTWDEEYLYVAAELEEPQVWATLTRRDTVIFYDNDFEVFIDPNGDNHEYYEFEMNALNTVWDLFLPKPYKDGGKPVDSWDYKGLKTAVHIRGTLNNPRDVDSGWSVEIAFPWKSLREHAHRPAPPHDGDQWRINFSRVEWKVVTDDGRYRKVPGLREDNWVWSPQWVIDMHRPETWGYLQFSTAAPGSVTFHPDSSWQTRMALHELYYAEKEYRRRHGQYALTLKELGLEERWTGPVPVLESRRDGYIATLVDPNGTSVHIREDSRIWEGGGGAEGN